MEANEANLATLKDILGRTMHPDNDTRKAAEAYLATMEAQPGFMLVLLHLVSGMSIATAPGDIAIRQAGSVFFKNAVKRSWNAEGSTIPHSDRATIKAHLINLMCSTPPDVQKQLSEAVSEISKSDFPHNWDSLMPQLVSKLGEASASGSAVVTKGVMLTVHSICKRYRYAFKSDKLIAEILLVLKHLAEPLTQTFIRNGAQIFALAGSGATGPDIEQQMVVAMETQRLIARIFYSLNWQDLPEFFEDHIAEWMEQFLKFLTFKHTALGARDEGEPGPIEKLRAAIVDNITLYVTKYEEEFAPYLPGFTQCIWQLLMEVGSQTKFDVLATSSIKFLTSVASKQINTGLFNEESLKVIVEKIVVPNLIATELDEEIFEDNPTDYIRKDMEGSDQDTRRRAAMELVRGLLKFFSPQVTQLCLGYIGQMLEQYGTTRDWRAKDAALHLVLAVSVKSSTATVGAGELNPQVNILDIFTTHVLPEIHDLAVNDRPIVKADAIKLVCVFRSHLQVPFLQSIMPHIIRHLSSSHVVIQTYAAYCVERFLTVKDRDATTGVSTLRMTKEHLLPFMQSLLIGLFGVLNNQDLPDNEYVMKCIMRVLNVLGNDVATMTSELLQPLNATLDRVCKNPINPHFNHYLFECIALLVRASCGIHGNALSTGGPQDVTVVAAACDSFERLLFPQFQQILAQDVAEFVPYVFQLYSQLLEARPAGSPLTESYRALLSPILTPTLWERKGNIPALTDLLRAFIVKGMREIIEGNLVTGILGVFQKLLSSKSTEKEAFLLLDTLFVNMPLPNLSPYIVTIFQLLLTRMQEQMKDGNKQVKFCRFFIHSLCLFSAVFGGQVAADVMSSIDPSVLHNIIAQVWKNNAEHCTAAYPHEIKNMIIGGSNLLTIPVISQREDVWSVALHSIVMLVEAETGGARRVANDEDDHFVDEEADAREFDSSYSRLAFVHSPDPELPASHPQSQIPAKRHFANCLGGLMQVNQGQYGAIMKKVLDANQFLFIQTTLQEAGYTIT